MLPGLDNSAVRLRRFGNYEIIRKLGRSMTDVYLALDPARNLRVVLKLIEHSPDSATRIMIEAERRGAGIQRQLREIDPRILEIYEIGEQSGCFFVAMEHFEGVSVAQLLETEHRLDPARAARCAIEVLSQLHVLHAFVSDIDGRRRAVVHGDIKPANIQIGADGSVRLLDFGIAKMITATHSLTSHNLGSPTYCSPERLAKSQVDAQADLWALAVSLYEMVSGTLPWQAVNTRRLEQLIQSRRPPRALPASCPPGLRAILGKALAGDIRRRYSSTEDFAADLRAFLEDRRTQAEAEPQAQKPPAWEANETVRKSMRESVATVRRAVTSLSTRGARTTTVAGILLGLAAASALIWYYRFAEESQPLREASLRNERSAAQIQTDWNLYQRISREGGFLFAVSPAAEAGRILRAGLLANAADVIASYRNSPDPVLTDFDWSRARLALSYAGQLGPADVEARGELALCEGYLNLIRNPPGAGSPQNDTQRSETQFQMAAADLPQSPDPHLALARLYIYGFRNAGMALSQFHEAERRGYRLGPREFEQEADGYLYRAEFELGRATRAASESKAEQERWFGQSWDDLERARVLYEPIYGFSTVSASLDQLHKDRKALIAARNAAGQAREPKPKPSRQAGRYGHH